ncbi:(Na+)-NQR maturation NqrM [Agaribacterium sp. ZY112]|uniref:(Na+)-NQR maturation NqrM n=1 Tax=Agaribacterium sp. ZY112 TaxID=3233574 RepID=UPI00352458A3
MTTFILAFVVLLVIVCAMAVGVIFANKPIKGSCGGMSALGMETECDVCGGDKVKCEKETDKLKAEKSKVESSKTDFYEAK